MQNTTICIKKGIPKSENNAVPPAAILKLTKEKSNIKSSTIKHSIIMISQRYTGLIRKIPIHIFYYKYQNIETGLSVSAASLRIRRSGCPLQSRSLTLARIFASIPHAGDTVCPCDCLPMQKNQWCSHSLDLGTGNSRPQSGLLEQGSAPSREHIENHDILKYLVTRLSSVLLM